MKGMGRKIIILVVSVLLLLVIAYLALFYFKQGTQTGGSAITQITSTLREIL